MDCVFFNNGFLEEGQALGLAGDVNLWKELLKGCLYQSAEHELRLALVGFRFPLGVIGSHVWVSLAVVASQAVAVEDHRAVLAFNLFSPRVSRSGCLFLLYSKGLFSVLGFSLKFVDFRST